MALYLKEFIFFKIYLFVCLFVEREEGREKERERNSNMWLPLTCPLLGTWPATQACALTGNRTSNTLVCRPALNPLSHTSQGSKTVTEHQFNHLNLTFTLRKYRYVLSFGKYSPKGKPHLDFDLRVSCFGLAWQGQADSPQRQRLPQVLNTEILLITMTIGLSYYL